MIMSPLIVTTLLACTIAALSSALPVDNTLAAVPVQDSQDPLNIFESEFLDFFILDQFVFFFFL